MTTTYTSGPWYAEKIDASPDHSWAIDSELVEIAKLPEWPDHQAEAEANARLIAAAPEMLEALREMLSMFGDHEQYDDDSAQVIAQTRQVIAKVKGGDA